MTTTIKNVATLKGWMVLAGHPSIKTRTVLIGNVYNHPLFEDGECVRTSRITDILGTFVITRSGTLYLLEEPTQGYKIWLNQFGYEYDFNNPIIE